MILEFITYYGTVISSYAQEPLSEVGNLYAVASGFLCVIVIIKELGKQ